MLKYTIFAAASFAATVADAATVTIDNFDSTAFQVVGAPTLGSPSLNPATSFGPTADAIGGFRTITATRTSPAGTENAFGRQVQVVVTDGEASVSLGAATDGFAVFSWNAGGADLTDGGTNNQLLLDVILTDLNVAFTLEIDGVSATRTAVGPSTLSYAFADFAGADFSNVGAISLMIGGPTSFDTLFDNVRASSSPITPVPLPAALPMLAFGVGGFALMRRRKTV